MPKSAKSIVVNLQTKENRKFTGIFSGESVLYSLISVKKGNNKTVNRVKDRWNYLLAHKEKIGYDDQDYMWFNENIFKRSDFKAKVADLTDWLKSQNFRSSVKWEYEKKKEEDEPPSKKFISIFTKLKNLFKDGAPGYNSNEFYNSGPFRLDSYAGKQLLREDQKKLRTNVENNGVNDIFDPDNIHQTSPIGVTGTGGPYNTGDDIFPFLDEWLMSSNRLTGNSLQPLASSVEFPDISQLRLTPKFEDMNMEIRQKWHMDRRTKSNALEQKLENEQKIVKRIGVLFSYDDRKAVLANEKAGDGEYYIKKDTTYKHPGFPEPKKSGDRKLYYPLSNQCWSPIVPKETQEIAKVQLWVATLQRLQPSLLFKMANKYLKILSENEPKCSEENKVQRDIVSITGGSFGFGDLERYETNFSIDESSASEQDKIIYCAAQAEYENKGGKEFGQFGELHLEHFYYRMAAVLYFSRQPLPNAKYVTLSQYTVIENPKKIQVNKLWKNGTTVIKATRKETVLSDKKFIEHLRKNNLIPTTVYETENFIFTAQPQGEDLTGEENIDPSTMSTILDQLKEFGAKGYYNADIKRGNFTKFTEEKKWTWPTLNEMRELFPGKIFGVVSMYPEPTVTVQPGVYLIDLDSFQNCGSVETFKIDQTKFKTKTKAFLNVGSEYLATTYKAFIEALWLGIKKNNDIVSRITYKEKATSEDFKGALKVIADTDKSVEWKEAVKAFFGTYSIEPVWWDLMSAMLANALNKNLPEEARVRLEDAFYVEDDNVSSGDDDDAFYVDDGELDV